MVRLTTSTLVEASPTVAPLPPVPQPDATLEAADRALEAHENARPRRNYLGMSALGHACSRLLWYDVHDPLPQAHDAATLKRFADGHASEDVLIARLRLVPGLTLLSTDPESGRQWALQDFDGRLQGHMDGVVLGLIQAPKTWHVFEAKAVGDKGFARLLKLRAELGEKQALAAWNPTYHVQAQTYMGYAGLERHWLVCCTPGARDWTAVRTEFDPAAFAAAKDKARRILEARVPLAKVSSDPAWYQCRGCAYHARCHPAGGGAP